MGEIHITRNPDPSGPALRIQLDEEPPTPTVVHYADHVRLTLAGPIRLTPPENPTGPPSTPNPEPAGSNAGAPTLATRLELLDWLPDPAPCHKCRYCQGQRRLRQRGHRPRLPGVRPARRLPAARPGPAYRPGRRCAPARAAGAAGMKALTALKTAAGKAEYYAAIQALARARPPEPYALPHRGERVEWQGETYRLNEMAADDLIIAYNRRVADPQKPGHLHLIGAGRKMLLIVEPMPTAPQSRLRRKTEAIHPCPGGHPSQARALLVKKQQPRGCRRCGQTPRLLPVAQNAEPTAAGYFQDPEDLPELWQEPVRATLADREKASAPDPATHLLNNAKELKS